MKPYFEVKVVKAKKKKIYSNQIVIDGKKYILYEDKNENVYPYKKKGNWVNGENLDEIKFPCFCRFTYCGTKYLGQINHCCAAKLPYRLINIGEQDDTNTYRQSSSLKELIESCDIHILKGKIIIFEEEK